MTQCIYLNSNKLIPISSVQLGLFLLTIRLMKYQLKINKLLISLSYLIFYEVAYEFINFIAGVKSGPTTVATLFFPPIAITMAYLLYFDFGLWIIPLIPIPIFLDAFIRGRPDFVYISQPLIDMIGYGFVAVVLKKIISFNPKLRTLKDGRNFLLFTGLGSLFVAFIYSFIRFIYLPNATPGYFEFASSFFIGDIVAIYSITPFLMVIIFPFLEKLFSNEIIYDNIKHYSRIFLIAFIISTIFTLVIFFQGIYIPTQILFLFFIPLSVIAVKYGIKGSILINNLIIIEVLTVLKFVQNSAFFEFQIVIFSLSSVALILGVVITERQTYLNSVEEIIKERTTRLENANNDLQFFSYSVSHDLQTPLKTVQQIIQLMLEENNPELDQETVNKLLSIGKYTERMEQLTDDLLKFFKLNEQELVKNRVDMNVLIKSAYNSTSKAYTDHLTELHFSDTLPSVLCDESLMLIVWTNLISNALKYSSKSEKSILEIGYLPKKRKKGIFYIRDNGIGFDMKDYSKLFVSFQRLHPEYEGTGIGLSLVKRIISKHGGTIWAESEPTKGSTFYFTL